MKTGIGREDVVYEGIFDEIDDATFTMGRCYVLTHGYDMDSMREQIHPLETVTLMRFVSLSIKEARW